MLNSISNATPSKKDCLRRLLRNALLPAVLIAAATLGGCSEGPTFHPWHIAELTEEFTVEAAQSEVTSFNDYLALEDRLFAQLREEVYAESTSGPDQALNRYSSGSIADPARWSPDWNRSFELATEQPVGGVLLLHGMSDSPYSLRSLGQRLHREGLHVIGLRLPGHGTAPSGLRHMTWQDMAAAVELAIDHLQARIGERPLHLVGYSTGAALALNATLDAVAQGGEQVPSSLVLISPAIRVHPAASLARFTDSLSNLPGLDSLAYLDLMDEFDPFKYNSFATNAGDQVHRITRRVDHRIRRLAADPGMAASLPPILVLKSAVDATVSTNAVVDNLLQRLPEGRNELVLFDINRNAAVQSTLLVDDPAPLTNRLLADPELPFDITFVSNRAPDSVEVVAYHKPAFAASIASREPLENRWPREVISLSHVALPIPPDDPLYGLQRPRTNERIFLGNLAILGEQGLLKLSESWLLRLRCNPFYGYLEDRAVEWLKSGDNA